MSTQQPPPPPAANGRRQIVVAPLVGHDGISLGKFLVVWATSTLINVTMLGLAFFVFLFLGKVTAGETETPEVTATTEVEDVQKDPDLTNTDLGMDDSLPLAYNVDRIEEGSIAPAGSIRRRAWGMVERRRGGPRSNMPPPPGSGGGTGG